MAALGHAERWQIIVGGVGAFVLVAMVMLAVNLAAAGGVQDELPFYLDYQASLREALKRGRPIMEKHGREYDGPEFQDWRQDVIRRIERYRPEEVSRMGQGISGMGPDYDIVETLIAGIERWHIGPARVARGEKTGRADRSSR